MRAATSVVGSWCQRCGGTPMHCFRDVRHRRVEDGFSDQVVAKRNRARASLKQAHVDTALKGPGGGFRVTACHRTKQCGRIETTKHRARNKHLAHLLRQVFKSV